MLEAVFEAVAGITFGLAEVVHQFALYALLAIGACVLISIPFLIVGILRVALRSVFEKTGAPMRSHPQRQASPLSMEGILARVVADAQRAAKANDARRRPR
jgi:hypothetical protein